MPPQSEDEDLLEKTKMSFSEHLEELRAALFKSLIAILGGTLVGLFFGWAVVDYIQTPLREALDTYYRNQAEQNQLTHLQEKQKAGEPVPKDIASAADQLAENGLVPEEIYIDPNELSALLGIELPQSNGGEFPTSREEMIRLRIYKPIESDPRLNVISLSGHEPFMVYVKASLVVGIVVASPFIFFFIWEFIAAGLYRAERKSVYTFLPMALGLFLAGAALAFYAAIDLVLDFLFWFNEQMGIQPTPRINDWMSFVLVLPLGFGISFQLPLIMVLLERIGIFTIESYRSKWRIAVLVIAILSMFLTPADPGSMLLMGVPLVGLYFGGILLCKYLPRSEIENPRVEPEE